MEYPTKIIHELAITLLQGLCIPHPNLEQCKAAEGFIRKVVLPIERDMIAKVGLTPREWLCLNFTANGFSAEETGKKLSLTTGTVKNYHVSIREKLQCKSIAQAVYKAFLQKEANTLN